MSLPFFILGLLLSACFSDVAADDGICNLQKSCGDADQTIDWYEPGKVYKFHYEGFHVSRTQSTSDHEDLQNATTTATLELTRGKDCTASFTILNASITYSSPNFGEEENKHTVPIDFLGPTVFPLTAADSEDIEICVPSLPDFFEPEWKADLRRSFAKLLIPFQESLKGLKAGTGFRSDGTTVRQEEKDGQSVVYSYKYSKATKQDPNSKISTKLELSTHRKEKDPLQFIFFKELVEKVFSKISLSRLPPGDHYHDLLNLPSLMNDANTLTEDESTDNETLDHLKLLRNIQAALCTQIYSSTRGHVIAVQCGEVQKTATPYWLATDFGSRQELTLEGTYPVNPKSNKRAPIPLKEVSLAMNKFSFSAVNSTQMNTHFDFMLSQICEAAQNAKTLMDLKENLRKLFPLIPAPILRERFDNMKLSPRCPREVKIFLDVVATSPSDETVEVMVDLIRNEDSSIDDTIFETFLYNAALKPSSDSSEYQKYVDRGGLEKLMDGKKLYHEKYGMSHNDLVLHMIGYANKMRSNFAASLSYLTLTTFLDKIPDLDKATSLEVLRAMEKLGPDEYDDDMDGDANAERLKVSNPCHSSHEGYLKGLLTNSTVPEDLKILGYLFMRKCYIPQWRTLVKEYVSSPASNSDVKNFIIQHIEKISQSRQSLDVTEDEEILSTAEISPENKFGSTWFNTDDTDLKIYGRYGERKATTEIEWNFVKGVKSFLPRMAFVECRFYTADNGIQTYQIELLRLGSDDAESPKIIATIYEDNVATVAETFVFDYANLLEKFQRIDFTSFKDLFQLAPPNLQRFFMNLILRDQKVDILHHTITREISRKLTSISGLPIKTRTSWERMFSLNFTTKYERSPTGNKMQTVVLRPSFIIRAKEETSLAFGYSEILGNQLVSQVSSQMNIELTYMGKGEGGWTFRIGLNSGKETGLGGTNNAMEFDVVVYQLQRYLLTDTFSKMETSEHIWLTEDEAQASSLKKTVLEDYSTLFKDRYCESFSFGPYLFSRQLPLAFNFTNYCDIPTLLLEVTPRRDEDERSLQIILHPEDESLDNLHYKFLVNETRGPNANLNFRISSPFDKYVVGGNLRFHRDTKDISLTLKVPFLGRLGFSLFERSEILETNLDERNMIMGMELESDFPVLNSFAEVKWVTDERFPHHPIKNGMFVVENSVLGRTEAKVQLNFEISNDVGRHENTFEITYGKNQWETISGNLTINILLNRQVQDQVPPTPGHPETIHLAQINGDVRFSQFPSWDFVYAYKKHGTSDIIRDCFTVNWYNITGTLTFNSEPEKIYQIKDDTIYNYWDKTSPECLLTRQQDRSEYFSSLTRENRLSSIDFPQLVAFRLHSINMITPTLIEIWMPNFFPMNFILMDTVGFYGKFYETIGPDKAVGTFLAKFNVTDPNPHITSVDPWGMEHTLTVRSHLGRYEYEGHIYSKEIVNFNLKLNGSGSLSDFTITGTEDNLDVPFTITIKEIPDTSGQHFKLQIHPIFVTSLRLLDGKNSDGYLVMLKSSAASYYDLRIDGGQDVFHSIVEIHPSDLKFQGKVKWPGPDHVDKDGCFLSGNVKAYQISSGEEMGSISSQSEIKFFNTLSPAMTYIKENYWPSLQRNFIVSSENSFKSFGSHRPGYLNMSMTLHPFIEPTEPSLSVSYVAENGDRFGFLYSEQLASDIYHEHKRVTMGQRLKAWRPEFPNLDVQSVFKVNVPKGINVMANSRKSPAFVPGFQHEGIFIHKKFFCNKLDLHFSTRLDAWYKTLTKYSREQRMTTAHQDEGGITFQILPNGESVMPNVNFEISTESSLTADEETVGSRSSFLYAVVGRIGMKSTFNHSFSSNTKHCKGCSKSPKSTWDKYMPSDKISNVLNVIHLRESVHNIDWSLARIDFFQGSDNLEGQIVGNHTFTTLFDGWNNFNFNGKHRLENDLVPFGSNLKRHSWSDSIYCRYTSDETSGSCGILNDELFSVKVSKGRTEKKLTFTVTFPPTIELYLEAKRDIPINNATIMNRNIIANITSDLLNGSGVYNMSQSSGVFTKGEPTITEINTLFPDGSKLAIRSHLSLQSGENKKGGFFGVAFPFEVLITQEDTNSVEDTVKLVGVNLLLTNLEDQSPILLHHDSDFQTHYDIRETNRPIYHLQTQFSTSKPSNLHPYIFNFRNLDHTKSLDTEYHKSTELLFRMGKQNADITTNCSVGTESLSSFILRNNEASLFTNQDFLPNFKNDLLHCPRCRGLSAPLCNSAKGHFLFQNVRSNSVPPFNPVNVPLDDKSPEIELNQGFQALWTEEGKCAATYANSKTVYGELQSDVKNLTEACTAIISKAPCLTNECDISTMTEIWTAIVNKISPTLLGLEDPVFYLVSVYFLITIFCLMLLF